MDYFGYGWHWLGWLAPVFFCLVLILIIVAALKYLFAHNVPTGDGRNTASPAALALLEERYARGEIKRDEFLQKQEDLRR